MSSWVWIGKRSELALRLLMMLHRRVRRPMPGVANIRSIVLCCWPLLHVIVPGVEVVPCCLLGLFLVVDLLASWSDRDLS
jgi:hypothetical protein